MSTVAVVSVFKSRVVIEFDIFVMLERNHIYFPYCFKLEPIGYGALLTVYVINYAIIGLPVSNDIFILM